MMFRLLRKEDIPFAMSLKEAAGWNQTRDNWQDFLSFRPEGCFLALTGDRPAGTVTTIDYQGVVGWIGMLLVLPELRGRGIGTELLKEAMESLERCETVKLDATPSGKRIYAPMGFLDEAMLERRVRSRGSTAREADSNLRPAVAVVSTLEPAELPAVLPLDAEAFGVSRENVLKAWLQDAPAYACLVREGGAIRGFCLGRKGSRHDQLGPLVADSFSVARALVDHALKVAGDRSIVLDATTGSAPWLRLLDSLGFAVERSFTRMYRGPNRSPGREGLVWAIAGPEVG
jgi:ribosomal protein S18 acetylase RimI-like enzyme